MASNNNSGEAMGFAIVVAIIGIAGLFMYALLAFVALLLTLVAFCAWTKPRKIFGSVLTPAEAHAFVGRGILGAALLPAFAVFCEVAFDIRIEDQYWPHLILGGYALGSLGLTMMLEDGKPAPENFEGLTIPGEVVSPQQTAAPTPGPWSKPEPSAFHFASWDDEEELGR